MKQPPSDQSWCHQEQTIQALQSEIDAKEESIRRLESENRRRILELMRAETELAQLKGGVTFRLLETALVQRGNA